MINIKKVRLTANYILTTKDTYNGESDGGVIIPAGTLKEYQKVVAVGPMVRTIAVGDVVSVNPKRYAVTKYDTNDVKGNIVDVEFVPSKVNAEISNTPFDSSQ